MATAYKQKYLPNHPIASKNGKVLLHRVLLFDALEGQDADCHWCGASLRWDGDLCVDHVDGDTFNNELNNLVPSCRGCNGNRSKPKPHHGTLSMYQGANCRCEPCRQAGSTYYRARRKAMAA